MLMCDEMMRQREEVSKEEEQITVEGSEGRELKVGRVHSAPELVVAQAQILKREAGAVKKKKLAGWSTKMLEDVADRQGFEDTEEMVQWRSIGQERVKDLWKELSGKMEEEVLAKYKVEEAKKGACQGRGEPLEWRIVKKKREVV